MVQIKMRLYLLFFSMLITAYSFKRTNLKTITELNSTIKFYNMSRDADEIGKRMKLFP